MGSAYPGPKIVRVGSDTLTPSFVDSIAGIQQVVHCRSRVVVGRDINLVERLFSGKVWYHLASNCLNRAQIWEGTTAQHKIGDAKIDQWLYLFADLFWRATQRPRV